MLKKKHIAITGILEILKRPECEKMNQLVRIGVALLVTELFVGVHLHGLKIMLMLTYLPRLYFKTKVLNTKNIVLQVRNGFVATADWFLGTTCIWVWSQMHTF